MQKTVTFLETFLQNQHLLQMNPKHCLENIPNKNTANSHENIFNPFDFQYILNNDENDPDINFFNNQYDAVNSPYFSLAEVP